ncbi:aminopeptidase N [Escherichia coli]|uniref:Aminopeptidase N n=1 Tax=Escherichia coli TaxID=562 RepID=A0A376W2M2_ECOLX|nr:aminopeptidase N [Escherichia coli]
MLVSKQFHEANNMTDALAALSAAVAAQLPCRDALMQEYDDKWHQDGLVMDKWFILQATSPAANVLETVRGLLQHRSFTMSNPNRIRSLIGAFAAATRQRSMPKMAAVISSWWKCLPTSTAVTRRWLHA